MSDKSERPCLVYVSGNPDQDQAIVQELEKSGFEITFCRQAAKLFTILEAKPKSWKPTIFVVDIILQGSSGFELIRRLSSKIGQNTIPLVMSSPYKSGEDLLEATSAGAVAVISKPFSAKDINDILEKERMKKLKSEIGAMAFKMGYD